MGEPAVVVGSRACASYMHLFYFKFDSFCILSSLPVLILDSRFWGTRTHIWGVNSMHFLMFFVFWVFFWGEFEILGGSPTGDSCSLPCRTRKKICSTIEFVIIRWFNNRYLSFKHVFDGLYRVVKAEGPINLMNGVTMASLRGTLLTAGQVGINILKHTRRMRTINLLFASEYLLAELKRNKYYTILYF